MLKIERGSSEAYEKGQRAYREGRFQSENPYPEYSYSWKEWDSGYIFEKYEAVRIEGFNESN